MSHRGVVLSETVGIVTGETISGSSKTNEAWPEFSVAANLAEDVAADLADVMDKRRLDNVLISMEELGQGEVDGRLGCGDTTPLWFLSEARGTSGTRRRVLPQAKRIIYVYQRNIYFIHQDLLIITSPKCHKESDIADLLDHCVTIGEEVGDILDHFEQRVVVVVPGDLSSGHRPSEDHPLLQHPEHCSQTRVDRGRGHSYFNVIG